jgi:hypothetical protein
MPGLAQDASPEPSAITIVRKSGHEDGEAQMKVNGKVRKISPHAVAAYTVREGEGALVIVLQRAKGDLAKQYVLRYYDLDSGRRRVLGAIPMDSAKVEETRTKGEAWAFALGGVDGATSQPIIVVGDDQAVPGRLPGATSPQIREDVLHYTATGEARETKLGIFLGTTKADIYAPPQTQAAPKLLQVFTNGTAMGNDCRWCGA